MSPIASTPEPPYFAVIFTSLKRSTDLDDYGATAQRMVELASQQPGYLGMEHVGDSAGAAITDFVLEQPGVHPELARSQRTLTGSIQRTREMVRALFPAHLPRRTGCRIPALEIIAPALSPLTRS